MASIAGGMAEKDTPPDTPAARNSFARRVVIAVGIALGMSAVALFLWYSVKVLLLAFAAILIGAVLRGLANWLAPKVRLPPGGALAVVILSIVGFFVILGLLLAPMIVSQFEQLADQLPRSVERLQQELRQKSWGQKILGPGNPNQPPVDQRDPRQPPPPGETVVSQAIQAATKPTTVVKAINYGRAVMEALFTLLLVVIVGIYLAAQPKLYVEGLLKLFPKSRRPRLREVMHATGHTLQWWTLGQLVPMLVIGTMTAIGLKLIGVPLWLPLAIITALLNFIPNFGPIIAAVPALLIAVTNNPMDAVWVAALFVVAQNLEGYLIMPLVQRRAVHLPPALTIISQVLLGLLLGPLGVILAAPLTAATMVVVKMLYVRDTLDTPVKVGSESSK